MRRLAVKVAKACMNNSAKIAGGLSAVGTFVAENNQRRKRIDTAQASWDDSAIRYPDTAEQLAQRHSLVSGFLSPMLRPGLVVVPSTAHQDDTFEATQCLERDGFGVRIKTLVTYPSKLWGDHLIKLLGEDEYFIYPSVQREDPAGILPLKQIPADYREGMTRFCLAHEATHANELHNIGLMALQSLIAAAKTGLGVRLLITMNGLGGSPVSFVVAAGLTILSMVDRSLVYDDEKQRFILENEPTNSAVTALAKSSNGLSDEDGTLQPTNSSQYVDALAKRYICEPRADSGAIRLVSENGNKIDRHALEGGRVYMWASSVHDSESMRRPFADHPSCSDRAKKIEAAQRRLGAGF